MSDFDVRAALDRVWAEPDSTPAVILRRAEELFAEHGFDGVTIRDIAGAAGVNVSTLHFHWRNKVTLFEAVHRNLDLYLLALMRPEPDDLGGLSLAQQIEAWVDRGLEMLASRPTCARLVMQYLSRHAPPESPDFLKHEQVLVEYVESEVRRHLPDDPELDVMLLMLCPTYFALLVYCDSPVQRVLLGGSIYESEAVRQRFRDFAVMMLKRMVGVAPVPRAPSEGAR